jgi:hypothetical protein
MFAGHSPQSPAMAATNQELSCDTNDNDLALLNCVRGWLIFAFTGVAPANCFSGLKTAANNLTENGLST